MEAYQKNYKFLEEKGLTLKPTASSVIPYALETDNLMLTLSEYNYLDIRNKKTNKKVTILLTEELLTDDILNAI